MTPELTVVIATRDRPQALARCLAGLQRQVDVAALEFVVVDDGSRDPDAVAKVAADAEAELLRQERRGQSAARNAGVGRAATPFVGFLDDDTKPVPVWAAAVLRRLRAGAAAVTGPIVPEPPDDQIAVASQLVANALVDADAAVKGTTASAPSANLACRADLVRVIPFDEDYTAIGPGIGAEDRDWCARVARAGVTLAFEPEASVHHAQDLTLREFLHRQYRYGRGARVYRVRYEGGHLAPARFYRSLIGKGFRTSLAVGTLVVAAQAATAAGYLRQAIARGDDAQGNPLNRRTESPRQSRAA